MEVEQGCWIAPVWARRGRLRHRRCSLAVFLMVLTDGLFSIATAQTLHGLPTGFEF